MTTKELAVRMTPELMRRILALPNSKTEQELAAAAILRTCAKAMMEGDPLTRIEAYELHQRICAWVWNTAAERSWGNYQAREIL